jgi:DNA-directed RNA polymerase subunit B'
MIGASVYLNGRLIGFHQSPKELIEAVRERRRSGELPYDLSAAYYEQSNEVYINADEGRVLRPLIVVEKGKPKLTQEHAKLMKEGKLRFSDLVKNGIAEFLDAEEEENAFIAMDNSDITEEHTHVEIHPSLILGICSALAPFPEHNSSPRVPMTSQMLKQALGIYAYNFALRTDTQSHIMYYPQVPIVQTKCTSIVGMDNKAAGQNFVIAVMPFYGYNINDAVIVNKASLERGLGRTVYYRTYEAEERRYPGGQKDRFERIKPEISGYRGEEAYKYLDEQGIIEPEFKVAGGDVLVGKTSPPRFLEEISELGVLEEKRRENSEAVRHGEQGTVDWVMLTEGEGGNRLIKIRIRGAMTPEIGDKFAARHGQKGVVGLIVDPCDMPFTESGLVPDLCINPHAISARMTVGFLLETVGAKAGSLAGRFVNSTPFENEEEGEMRETLREYGFAPTGKEVVYDGITGRHINAQIYNGVVYYQRLKHLVANKLHARARGPVQILTRQPTEGRAREGGLRFGEMERDCLIGHGASMLLMERLLEESDKVTELICSKCGMIAVDDQIRKKKYCHICGETEVYPIELSYAFKLLLNELKGMGLYPKIKLEDKV